MSNVIVPFEMTDGQLTALNELGEKEELASREAWLEQRIRVAARHRRGCNNCGGGAHLREGQRVGGGVRAAGTGRAMDVTISTSKKE